MSKTITSEAHWKKLRETVIHCTRCPRLVEYRENVPPKPAFKDQRYWRKPVPGFGDPKAWLLITGLAPAGDGGNRTGRIFTGDGTGRFLFKALFSTGFANQPTSESRDDGLIVKGCYLTAAVKCVPPMHRPTPQECLNCHSYYMQEIELLSPSLKAILALGHLAFKAILLALRKRGIPTKGLVFKHGASYKIENVRLYCSYHPTPRNVNTGTLTEKMFLDLLKTIKKQVG